MFSVLTERHNTCITQVARAHGTLVALTAGDAGLVARKRDDLWAALRSGVDLLFTNQCAPPSLSQPASHAMHRLEFTLRRAFRRCCSQSQAPDNLVGSWISISTELPIECVDSPSRSEAAALLGRECGAEEAALALGPHADMVVVTAGADGSCISALGSLQVCARLLFGLASWRPELGTPGHHSLRRTGSCTRACSRPQLTAGQCPAGGRHQHVPLS